MQGEWLAAARSRLLRRAQIATRRRVLELGCGHALVTNELQRRAGGCVVGLDRHAATLARAAGTTEAGLVCANAEQLPFAERTFELVFCQWTWLWLEHPARVAAEVARVLQAGECLLAIEPDFGGLIEYPPALFTRDLWLEGLRRAGADPLIGRRLPAVLAAAGFEVRVDLLDRLEPSSSVRLDLLAELPLTEDERARLAAVRQADAMLSDLERVVHLPMFLITARTSRREGGNS